MDGGDITTLDDGDYECDTSDECEDGGYGESSSYDDLYDDGSDESWSSSSSYSGGDESDESEDCPEDSSDDYSAGDDQDYSSYSDDGGSDDAGDSSEDCPDDSTEVRTQPVATRPTNDDGVRADDCPDDEQAPAPVRAASSGSQGGDEGDEADDCPPDERTDGPDRSEQVVHTVVSDGDDGGTGSQGTFSAPVAEPVSVQPVASAPLVPEVVPGNLNAHPALGAIDADGLTSQINELENFKNSLAAGQGMSPTGTPTMESALARVIDGNGHLQTSSGMPLVTLGSNSDFGSGVGGGVVAAATAPYHHLIYDEFGFMRPHAGIFGPELAQRRIDQDPGIIDDFFGTPGDPGQAQFPIGGVT